AVGKFLVPFPRALDNCLQRLELRSPTEFFFDLFRRCYKPGWIARPARLFDCGDLSSGDFSANLDYFANGGAAAGAEVVKCAGRRAKRQDVCSRKVNDMDVVANTCSICRLVIGAVNFDIRFSAKRDLKHVGDQMCLLTMIFPEALSRTSCVEVAQ